jgi:anaerobic selenocysteine-containing dehydrogenase
VPPAHRLLPGTDGALALGLMHELIVHDWLDHDYIERHVDGWPALRERALQWPPERAAATCGITADEVRQLARDYGTTAPAAIRLNYGMQRVHGGGNAVRLIALLPCLTGAWRHRAGGCCCRRRAGSSRAQRRRAAAARPAGRPPPAHHQHEHHRRRPAARGLARLRPAIEALVVYNSNPVAVAPESAKVVQASQREDLFTVVLEHFLTDTADHADYRAAGHHPAGALGRAHQLRPHLCADQRAGDRAAGRGRPTRRSSASWRASGLHRALLQDSDEASWPARPSRPMVDFEQLQRAGWVALPVPEAPFADGGFPTPSGQGPSSAPGPGRARLRAQPRARADAPELAQRYPLAMISPPARNFLNSSFVNVPEPARIEGEPLLEMHPVDAAPRGISRRPDWCASSTTAAATAARPR